LLIGGPQGGQPPPPRGALSIDELRAVEYELRNSITTQAQALGLKLEDGLERRRELLAQIEKIVKAKWADVWAEQYLPPCILNVPRSTLSPELDGPRRARSCSNLTQ
jgi:hypothetical protein